MDSEHDSHANQVVPSSPSTIVNVGLDFSDMPPVAVLSAHMTDSEEKDLKFILHKHGASPTSDLSKAKVFIGKVGTKRRAEFELRSRKLFTEDDCISSKRPANSGQEPGLSKKRRLAATGVARLDPIYGEASIAGDKDQGSSGTEEEEFVGCRDSPFLERPNTVERESAAQIFESSSSTSHDVVWVVKSNWVKTCKSAGRLVPLGEHLVYKGRITARPNLSTSKTTKDKVITKTKVATVSQQRIATKPQAAREILDRAQADSSTFAPRSNHAPRDLTRQHHGSRRLEGHVFATSSNTPHAAPLLHNTTSEYEGEDNDVPSAPEWVKKGIKYACQRYTPANGPNEDFLEQLTQIRTARTLLDDQVGIRAYSTIIAAIAAYPYRLNHPREIAQLPGCDEKTVALFTEWKNTGKIQAVRDFQSSDKMRIINEFYNIWGVGAKTARQFYNKGWRECDDIIEYGWDDLERKQQIGMKYYDEFLDPIPRAEVEQICKTIRDVTVSLRDQRITATIVGGYRRGNRASGDVDVIISHPELEATAGLIQDIVTALEERGYITHTLLMSLTNTQRGQETLPFRNARAMGRGFDTLDKALLVWQDPSWPSREQHIAADVNAKNPNVHRRVDIIVSPWRTVGCAVTGWSGGTTFQRDIRRYAKEVKGWKFDSSGIRGRSTGDTVWVEGLDGVDGTPEEAERVVFRALGLEFVPPEGRVTH